VREVRRVVALAHDGLAMDEISWKEEEHPRAKNGEFAKSSEVSQHIKGTLKTAGYTPSKFGGYYHSSGHHVRIMSPEGGQKLSSIWEHRHGGTNKFAHGFGSPSLLAYLDKIKKQPEAKTETPKVEPKVEAEISKTAIKLPKKPGPITSPSNAHNQKHLDTLEALALAGKWDALLAYKNKLKGSNGYARMIQKYGDELLAARSQTGEVTKNELKTTQSYEDGLEFHATDTVSELFQSRVKTTWSMLPESVKSAVVKNGTQVRMGFSTTEVMPHLKDMAPRGWPKGSTWDMAEGLYSPSINSVVVSENLYDRSLREFIPTPRAKAVLRHEIGHAYDRALANSTDPGVEYSQSQKFREDYNDDYNAMDLKAGRYSGIGYYLQEGNAGPSETFAEITAQVMAEVGSEGVLGTGGSSLVFLKDWFPKTYAHIKTLIIGETEA
jgi:hypothetical protein